MADVEAIYRMPIISCSYCLRSTDPNEVFEIACANFTRYLLKNCFQFSISLHCIEGIETSTGFTCACVQSGLGKNVASKDLHTSGASASNLPVHQIVAGAGSCIRVSKSMSFWRKSLLTKKMETCTLLINKKFKRKTTNFHFHPFHKLK